MNFQRVPGYPFEINTGTRAAVYHISDTPNNYILLEISGSHSNIISDSYVFHYGNELVSRTGNKEICHFITTNYDQKYPFAVTNI